MRKTLAEAIGTFMIVFCGCGSLMIANRLPGSISPFAIPLIFGLVVAAMIYSVGHISGAHFNPAVTLAFAASRHFPLREVFAYWVAQFGGAIVAILLLKNILPAGSSYGATLPSVTLFQALVWEGLLTFALMFVIVAVATDTRAVGTMAGAAIGAIVMVGALVGGPITGASMNPARSLAPAMIEGNFQGLWIYFVGPGVGAVLASLLYQWIRCEEPTKEAKGCC